MAFSACFLKDVIYRLNTVRIACTMLLSELMYFNWYLTALRLACVH